MKLYLLLFTFSFNSLVSAQQDSVKRFPGNDGPVAFIKGHRYEKKVNTELFKKDLQLSLSDSTYEIVSFRVTWDNAGTSVISEKMNTGPVVKIEGFFSSLAELIDGSFISFEAILIRKNDQLYYVPAFAIKTVNRPEADNYAQKLARCDFRLGPYRNNDLIRSPTFLSTDLELIPNDTTYIVAGFELFFVNRSGDEFKTVITSNTINLDKDDVTRKLKALDPGCSFYLENIRVYKNGKLYEADNFSLYVK